MTEGDRNLLAVWQDIANNEEGNPVIRMDRAVLRSLLDLIERVNPQVQNGDDQ